MTFETVELTIEPPLAILRLNRPHRMNAVIERMYREIGQALDRCAAERAVRAVILTGSVLRRDGTDKHAFCAGADLKEHAAGTRTPAERHDYIRLAHETTLALWQFPRPVVAAVNGPARGAGAELAINCDFVLMAEEASLGFPEIRLGTFVGGGVTHVLPRLVGLARAKELIYTGRVVEGAEAVRLGLATDCCPRAELDQRARALASHLAEGAPLSLSLAKHHLHASSGLSIEQALERETQAIADCMETADWQEGVRAFAGRRPPRFEGR